MDAFTSRCGDRAEVLQDEELGDCGEDQDRDRSTGKERIVVGTLLKRAMRIESHGRLAAASRFE